MFLITVQASECLQGYHNIPKTKVFPVVMDTQILMPFCQWASKIENPGAKLA